MSSLRLDRFASFCVRCMELRDLSPLRHSVSLQSLHVLHCPLVRGRALTACLNALQTSIRSVRILDGDHMVHHTKLVLPRRMAMAPTPPPERLRLGDALEQRQVEVAMMATAPTPPPERLRLGDALEQRQVAMATAPIVWTVPPPKIQVEIYTTVVMSYRYRDYQLSAEALNYVLRTFEALGFRPCGPVVHHAHPRDNNTVQRDYESIVRLAHQDDARNVSSACNLGIWDYGHVKVPQEDTTVFVRTSRGRWRRRRRLLKHASAG